MVRTALIERRSVLWTTWIFLAFFIYVMGTISLLHPSTRPEALQMTPIALLLTTGLLLLFASTPYTIRMVVVFATIAIVGFLAELAGVQTGWIFGNYEYTNNFGIRWWGTPPLIGINWLFLSYAWAAVTGNTAHAPAYRILYASFSMLAYDLLLEQAAPLMQLWHWKEGYIPWTNYSAWFVLALFFQWLIHHNHIVTRNRIALPLLLLQILMFVCIIFFIR